MSPPLKRWWPLIRLLVSAGLVAYLVTAVDFQPLREVLPRFRAGYYLAGIGVMALYVVLQAWILSRLLGLRGIPATTGTMIRFNCISSFFGVFLPGGAGADLVMAFRLCRDASDKAGVLAAILYARVAGLLAMTALTLVAAIATTLPFPGAAVVTGVVLAAAVVLLAAHRAIGSRAVLVFFPGRWRDSRPALFLVRMLDALKLFTGFSGKTLAPVIGLLLMGLARGAMDYLMARAVGVVLPFPYFIAFSTLVSLITLLPVSIAGIGVREMTFAGLFTATGVAGSLGIAVSLLSFSLSLWVAVAGGILYAIKGWKAT